MISNQILQNTIEGITSISRTELCVTDTEGRTVVSTYVKTPDFSESVKEFAASPADSQESNGNHYFKIADGPRTEYVLIVSGSGDNAYLVGKMAAFQLKELLVAYRERFDKDNFIKNLLLDNLLLVDIYGRARKLHLSINARRVVLIAETPAAREFAVKDMVKDCFGASGEKEIVTAVDENSVVIVKELQGDAEDQFAEEEEVKKSAAKIIEYLKKEDIKDVRIACGAPVDEIKDVSRSYKEAKVALDVGGIFSPDRQVISYRELGIGRLIYQLPMPLCQMFIDEIFGDRDPEEFDEETVTTINKFFENSLNVSETSRQLFIHRNTLVYRLDKLQKNTGLDLRIFDDAITFKIAMMVVKYMKFMQAKDF